MSFRNQFIGNFKILYETIMRTFDMYTMQIVTEATPLVLAQSSSLQRGMQYPKLS